MTKKHELARLGEISNLILDVKLAALRTAAQKRQQSLDLLANLNGTVADTDLTPVVAYQTTLRYQHWADVRRAEINLVLARQTADMLAAREDAGQAFGKDQALRSLQKKLG
jgi:hypothetical protein